MPYALTDKSFVIRTADGAYVPDDPTNRDWRAYQAWIAAGNKPRSARPAPEARRPLAPSGPTSPRNESPPSDGRAADAPVAANPASEIAHAHVG